MTDRRSLLARTVATFVVCAAINVLMSGKTRGLQDGGHLMQRKVVAERLILRGSKGPKSIDMTYDSSGQYSIWFSGSGNVSNLRLGAAGEQGDPVAFLWDTRSRFRAGVVAHNQDGTLLSMTKDDESRMRLEIRCGAKTLGVSTKGVRGRAGLFASTSARPHLAFLDLSDRESGPGGIVFQMHDSLARISLASPLGQPRTWMSLLSDGSAGLFFCDGGMRNRLSFAVAAGVTPTIGIMDRLGKIVPAVP